MSKYGRWRDDQAEEFDFWWRKHYGTRDGPMTASDGTKILTASSKIDEELARVIAKNAWMAALDPFAP